MRIAPGRPRSHDQVGPRVRHPSHHRVPLRAGPPAAPRDLRLHGRRHHGGVDGCGHGAAAGRDPHRRALGRSGRASSRAPRRARGRRRARRRSSVGADQRLRARRPRCAPRRAPRRARAGRHRVVAHASPRGRRRNGARSALHLRAPRHVLGVRLCVGRRVRLGSVLRAGSEPDQRLLPLLSRTSR